MTDQTIGKIIADAQARKRLADLDEEAGKNHYARLLSERNGQTFVQFRKPGDTILSGSGARYVVGKCGELRKIEEKKR